ncbi:hypothetical protein [Burkholderia anthina]|uniref:hypothetical protein n=1 Tax=Burkholderia anthina TaxID=179879 RepID=UPI00158A7815|nr:hypothetical protein [Burkholderia anthina]
MRHPARLLVIAALSAHCVAAFAAVDCEQQGPTMEAVRRCVLDARVRILKQWEAQLDASP